MLSVVGGVLSKAVGIAITPFAVIFVILMLISERGRRNAIGFAIGWMFGVAVVTGAALVLADGAGASTDEGTQGGIHILHLILGLLFAYLAVKTWRTRPREGEPEEQPKIFAMVDSLSPIKAAGIGLALAAIAPKNLALDVGAGTTMALGGLTGAADVIVILIFTLVASIAVLIPVIAVLVMGDRSKEPLDRVKQWLIANNSTIMLVLFVLLGARFLGTGLGVFG